MASRDLERGQEWADFSDLPDAPEAGQVARDTANTILDLGFSPDVFRERVAKELVIEDKQTGAFRIWGPLLKRNPPQLQLLQLILREAKRGGPIRILVLKGRKVGVSTALELLLLELAMQLPGWTVGVVAHTDESTQKLLSIARNAYEHLPPTRKPELRYHRKNYLEFGKRHMEDRADGDMGHTAKFCCATAAGVYPFSGDTVRALHLSECAKYDSIGDIDEQKRFILSALQAVPKTGPSIIVAETTANGQQGWFYETWKRAESDGKGADGMRWIPFFISWLHDPTTRQPVPEGYNWSDWPAEDMAREADLRARFCTSAGRCLHCGIPFDEHLMFRRFVIYNEMANDHDLFDQEFPTTATSAFLSSGRPGIPRAALDAQEGHIAHPVRRLSSRIDEDIAPLTFGIDGDGGTSQSV